MAQLIKSREEKRQELHEKLVSILGSRNVYFQPPESVKIQYPALIYSMAQDKVRYASNNKYKTDLRYTCTYVTKSPDDGKLDEFLQLPYSAFDRHYNADNLNHYVFVVHY